MVSYFMGLLLHWSEHVLRQKAPYVFRDNVIYQLPEKFPTKLYSFNVGLVYLIVWKDKK